MLTSIVLIALAVLGLIFVVYPRTTHMKAEWVITLCGLFFLIILFIKANV